MTNAMDKAMRQLFGADPADEVSGTENGISFVKHRSEAVGFPKGWYREETIKTGAGIMNPSHRTVTYVSPTGQKFRSKAELARFFGSRMDLLNFDFKSGKLASSGQTRKNGIAFGKLTGKNGISPADFAKPTTLNILRMAEPPSRQCTCITNQKVRSIETCGTNVLKDAPASGKIKTLKPKPMQVFWAKRLENLRSDDSATSLDVRALPNGFKAATSILTDSAALTTLATAVYNASNVQSGVVPDSAIPLGQKETAERLKNNPGAFTNPYQPMITATKISAELIEEQELQVQRLRKQLADLIVKEKQAQKAA